MQDPIYRRLHEENDFDVLSIGDIESILQTGPEYIENRQPVRPGMVKLCSKQTKSEKY